MQYRLMQKMGAAVFFVLLASVGMTACEKTEEAARDEAEQMADEVQERTEQKVDEATQKVDEAKEKVDEAKENLEESAEAARQKVDLSDEQLKQFAEIQARLARYNAELNANKDLSESERSAKISQKMRSLVKDAGLDLPTFAKIPQALKENPEKNEKFRSYLKAVNGER